jgi:hypothetical protein
MLIKLFNIVDLDVMYHVNLKIQKHPLTASYLNDY